MEAGDPDGEVNLAWQCYQQLRSIYHATTTEGRRIAEEVIAGFPTCPIPDVARLGRTLDAWENTVLAYFDTRGVSTVSPMSRLRRTDNAAAAADPSSVVSSSPTSRPSPSGWPPAKP